ncbi:MAG: hypothetical protein PHQ43_08160 [Dehalococcoidales bacterium]|nr:hypothetical protein [Dehalococcoidales bacterium]
MVMIMSVLVNLTGDWIAFPDQALRRDVPNAEIIYSAVDRGELRSGHTDRIGSIGSSAYKEAVGRDIPEAGKGTKEDVDRLLEDAWFWQLSRR